MFEERARTRCDEAAADSGSWYALVVKPRHEKAVARSLSYKGLTEFLPVYGQRRRWSDRVKRLELPLFPGYVFCQFPLQSKTDVLATPGVRSIVAFGSRPALVPAGEIEAVRAMAASGLTVQPWPYLERGQAVAIRTGPLRGLTGMLAQAGDSWQVVVNVDLLRRSVAVTTGRDSIEVLAPAVPAGRPSERAV
jgi:transcription antitermination factor NusG